MKASSMFKRAIVTAVLLASPALAAPNGLSADHPWIRATPPGAITAAGYLTLNNRGVAADRLTGGSTPAARNLTIHRTLMSDGMMRMSAVPSLQIRPGRAIPFKPGGYHLMLVGLKAPLKAGQVVPVTLTFERAGSLTVPFVVEQPKSPTGDPPIQHTH